MSLNFKRTRDLLYNFQFSDLFIEELGWSKPSRQKPENHFYGEFLKALFFESFAKHEIERDLSVQELVGKVKYLNGGLFLKHHIEDKYQISIVDKAFEQVLDLFGRYSWNLDDTPEGKDDEINPDVLGYIFEKYIKKQ
ncbi:MAG: hypothetical protein HWQ43_02445 [Nostoc sp. JL31]|uniref:type IIG restriction enzyme/methyltransferase n=1 Tax=Nostoc sp. JL31 TaxID=2815395 RepID=UPI0025DE0F12|nr:hypothetical protein [Nostoc sp. JL31]MBN3888075.1 hypothetical protein [Nostoc sp. JL31]